MPLGTALTALLAGALQAVPAPPAPVPDSVTVVAGDEYRAGGIQRLLFGSKYRELWATPIRVEVLDPARFAGGLTPVREGGGGQTRSLRLEGADGREYTFRSVNKFQNRGLGPVRRTLFGWFRQDQISSLHPAAALVAAPLLEAAGVLRPDPRLVVMPDHPALGPYRMRFRGMLGTLEEHPEEGEGDAPGFAGSRKVVGTDDLWERLEEDPRDRIDARAYLAARLMDLYLGDWDRHADQYRWASFGAGEGRIWVPVSRDRDYAFSHYDGWLPSLARLVDPKVVRFDREYKDLRGLLVKPRSLDLRILCGLPRSTWDATTAVLQRRLTDPVIADAVLRMPPEYYRLNGTELSLTLSARRENLPYAADRFYRTLHVPGGCETE